MKKLLLSAAFILSAAGAYAAVTANDLVTSYQTEGFNAIEVTTGVTQIKVEAVKAGTKVEVIYDIATGTILKQEQKPARARDINDTSVEVQTSATDFTNGSDDDSDDDRGRGRGRGSDDGPGHDMGDDHGGNDHSDGHSSGHGSDDDDDDHGGSGNSGHGGGDDHGDDGDED